MILTCPECGTQYVVKDGAIPPQGRQVRCAACKHSWHQDPEALPPEEPRDETLAEATLIEPRSGVEAEERAYEAAMAAPAEPALEGAADHEFGEAADENYAQVPEAEPARSDFSEPEEPAQVTTEPVAPYAPEPSQPAPQPIGSFEPAYPSPPAQAAAAETADWSAPPEPEAQPDEFSPFAEPEDEAEPKRRGALGKILLLILVIAAIAAAFWFFAPDAWKARLGLAGAGVSPLALVTTHMDRQRLESGNELLTVTGRVVNPTDKDQAVPPLQALLKTRGGKLVYRWTIPPPARTLPPGASADFNSTEVDVPPGGDELTITLGSGQV